MFFCGNMRVRHTRTTEPTAASSSTPKAEVSSTMSGIWGAYNKALAKNPLLVKAMTSFTGFTIGDILAQKFINPGEKYDFARTMRLGACAQMIKSSCASKETSLSATKPFLLT